MTTNLLPYLLELRDTTDAALFRLQEFRGAAESWLRLASDLDASVKHAGDPERAETFQSMMREQSRLFDALEAFLAAWARISLILFPVLRPDGSPALRAMRGIELRQRLGLLGDSPLGDRDFRDAWMHFDERLDAALERGVGAQRQRFLLAAEADVLTRESVLRLIEVDAGAYSWRDRDGGVHRTELSSLEAALRELETVVGQVLHGS